MPVGADSLVAEGMPGLSHGLGCGRPPSQYRGRHGFLTAGRSLVALPFGDSLTNERDCCLARNADKRLQNRAG
jgi:hypothetical protein